MENITLWYNSYCFKANTYGYDSLRKAHPFCWSTHEVQWIVFLIIENTQLSSNACSSCEGNLYKKALWIRSQIVISSDRRYQHSNPILTGMIIIYHFLHGSKIIIIDCFNRSVTRSKNFLDHYLDCHLELYLFTRDMYCLIQQSASHCCSLFSHSCFAIHIISKLNRYKTRSRSSVDTVQNLSIQIAI